MKYRLIKLCHTLLIYPIEFKCQVHCTSHNDDAEVVDHKIGLRYGHHHAILFLEIVKHLQKVEVCPALEKYNGRDNCDKVQNEEQEEVGDGALGVLRGLVVPVAVADVAEHCRVVSRGGQQEAGKVTEPVMCNLKVF